MKVVKHKNGFVLLLFIMHRWSVWHALASDVQHTNGTGLVMLVQAPTHVASPTSTNALEMQKNETSTESH